MVAVRAVATEGALATAVELSFPWANDIGDAGYRLQFSSDLSTWSDHPFTVVETVAGELTDQITIQGDSLRLRCWTATIGWPCD